MLQNTLNNELITITEENIDKYKSMMKNIEVGDKILVRTSPSWGTIYSPLSKDCPESLYVDTLYNTLMDNHKEFRNCVETDEIKHMTAEEIIYINKFLTDRKGTHEVVQQGVVEAILKHDGYEASPNILSKAVYLYGSLRYTKPFKEENHKTALTVLLYFMVSNGIRLKKTRTSLLEDMERRIQTGDFDEDYLLRYLTRHSMYIDTVVV